MVDIVELRKTWDLFVREGGFTEVRIIGRFQYSGYFRSFDNLAKQLEPFTEMDDEQIYIVMNEIDRDCYARPQCEKFVKGPKATSKDDEIVRRRFLLCDFDPVRMANTSSTDEQFEKAHAKAQEVYRFLRNSGFPDMVVAISGNGWHLLVPCDLPCDEDTDAVVRRFYDFMALRYSDSEVEFDRKVYNAARITKAYGTWAKKGADLPTNPWRQSKIVHIPENILPVSYDALKALSDLAPNDEPKPQQGMQQRYAYRPQFDIRSWMYGHNVQYREKSNGSGVIFELEECPWIDTHSDRKKWDSAIFVGADGKITFNCTHSHCSGKTWRDFRLHYEPDAYDRPFSGPVVRQWVPAGQVAQRKPTVREEIPELGSKWFSMSEIKKLDLDRVERVGTGFPSLDKDIYGLVMGEITILSGSTASGKSSLLDTILLNIVDQGWKAAVWSGELPASMLKNWLQTSAAGKGNLSPSKIREGTFYVPDAVGRRIDSWLDGRLYIYNNDYGTKWEQIFSDMELLLGSGVRVFVLDNLFTLDIDIFGGDTNRRQKELIIQIKELAKSKSVHIVLVAHPRKTNAFIRRTDISGSSDITNAADNVFIIHRVGNDFMKAGGDFFGHATVTQYGSYGNVVEVCKNRLFGVADKLYGLFYDPITRRFSEDMTFSKRYGWETEQPPAPVPSAPTPPVVPDTSNYDEYMRSEEESLGDPSDNYGFPF